MTGITEEDLMDGHRRPYPPGAWRDIIEEVQRAQGLEDTDHVDWRECYYRAANRLTRLQDAAESVIDADNRQSLKLKEKAMRKLVDALRLEEVGDE